MGIKLYWIMGFADKKFLSIKKESKIINSDGKGEQHPIVWWRSQLGQLQWCTNSTTAIQTLFYGPIKCLRSGKAGEAQLLQEGGMLSSHGPKKNERGNFAQEQVQLSVKKKNQLLSISSCMNLEFNLKKAYMHY